jgi:hypothetical protein
MMSDCKALLKHELHTAYLCLGLYDTLYTDPVLSGKIRAKGTRSVGSTVAASQTAKGESCTGPRAVAMPTLESKHWWSADFHLACRPVYAQLHFKLLLTKAVLVVHGHME